MNQDNRYKSSTEKRLEQAIDNYNQSLINLAGHMSDLSNMYADFIKESDTILIYSLGCIVIGMIILFGLFIF